MDSSSLKGFHWQHLTLNSCHTKNHCPVTFSLAWMFFRQIDKKDKHTKFGFSHWGTLSHPLFTIHKVNYCDWPLGSWGGCFRTPTLDAALEEGLAAFTGPHPVVVPRGIVTAYGTKAHVFARLKAPSPGSSPRLPDTVWGVAGATLVLSGNRVLAGRDTGPGHRIYSV